MKTIVFTSASAKQFDALPLAAQAAIEAALGRYAIDGHGEVKRLSGREGYRLRIGSNIACCSTNGGRRSLRSPSAAAPPHVLLRRP
jgi:hypothetical protein